MVLVIDDEPVIRRTLRAAFTDAGLLVEEAADGLEGLEQVRRRVPALILVDLLMPVMDGLESTKAIRTELPEVEVIALTSVLEGASVTGAVRAGAIGYLLKDTDAEELHRAIRGAAEGRVQLAPEAAARLMREVRAPENPEALTDREAEVLRLLARGKANKQIASGLYVSEKTVKAHVSSILMKLGVHSRTQAALYAVRTGLVSMDELSEEPW